MSSFFEAAVRLVLRRRPGEGRMTEEHGQNLAGRPPGGEPNVMPQAPAPAADPFASRENRRQCVYLNPEEDPLTFFRLMLGIQTTPYLGFTLSSPLGTRPAANIGLYARIVYSEQKAKDSFKVFSVVINGCYFLQIVIAAALTALGAARASSGAVTAFGALNTVIAGLLTFLKGSGLPGRLKYYGNEWKKIREFIEQRERDFMRSGHNLDVYDVIETIEKMYNNLKADIELNTPDSYTSVTSQRRAGDENKIGGFDASKLEALASKLKGFENGKIDSFAAGIREKAENATKNIQQHEKQIEAEVEHLRDDVVRDVQGHRARLDREARDREAQARAAINEGKQTARNGVEERRAKLDDTVEEHRRKLDNAADEQHARALETMDNAGRAAQEGIDSATSHASGSISSLVREIGEIHRTAVSGGRVAAAQQIRSLAQRLGGHADQVEERKPEAEKKPGI
ncbi:hypothetical protein GQX73_g4608 [Xylaria multiplex]|uniref:SMODS and SLOG-associating 2TM effector domain-containing protein n=1 Tax=Xylaria multiplex TaxID=323545 RepID=A0A7C8IXR3_9PEZI|nr:hypothetical protein GQX73_g4608 [Xylaria multiplex]